MPTRRLGFSDSAIFTLYELSKQISCIYLILFNNHPFVALPTWPAAPAQQPQWLQRSGGGGEFLVNFYPYAANMVINEPYFTHLFLRDGTLARWATRTSWTSLSECWRIWTSQRRRRSVLPLFFSLRWENLLTHAMCNVFFTIVNDWDRKIHQRSPCGCCL